MLRLTYAPEMRLNFPALATHAVIEDALAAAWPQAHIIAVDAA